MKIKTNMFELKFFTKIRKLKVFFSGFLEAFFIQGLIFLFLYFYEKTFKVPSFFLERDFSYLISFFLLFLFILIVILGLKKLSPEKIFEKKLVQDGIYSFSRHPFYGAIVFFFNPALSFIFRSWFLLAGCFLSYFLWRKYTQKEEKELKEIFPKEYFKYEIKTPRYFFPNFLPKLYLEKKSLYYLFSGLISFSLILVSSHTLLLNLDKIKNLSWFSFNTTNSIFPKELEKIVSEEKISYIKIIDAPLKNPVLTETINNSSQISQSSTQSSNPTSLSSDFNPNLFSPPASLSIAKISLEAPIVFPETFQQINSFLLKGIIHYPGTAFPGEKGTILLSGHSSGFFRGGYKNVFANLDKLEEKDEIIIKTPSENYYYQVFKKEILLPNEVKIIEYKNNEVLILLSCWPVGTDLKRIIIQAIRVK